MSDPTGGTGPDGHDDEPTLVDHRTSSGLRARWTRRSPAEADDVQHSPLVGFMSVPVHRLVPIRRSTLVLVVAFLGLGTLLYFNPPNEATGKGAVVNGYFVPGAVPVSTTTTTTPPTTTPPPTSTTTTRGPPVTATTAPVFPPATTTTTARGPSTTTSSAPPSGGAGGFGGAAGSTTTTTGAQVGATGSTGPTTPGP